MKNLNLGQKMPLVAVAMLGVSAFAQDQRPNILWIMNEDWGKDLSCYGCEGVYTPNLDKLASEGILFNNAFTTAPVSSTARSAMMTGFYQNYIGANQHRLSKEQKKPLPYGIKAVPKLFEEAGYYTCLMSWKTDVNFLPCDKEDLFMDCTDWPENHKIGWHNRKSGQPFFARITFSTTHRSFDRDPKRPIRIDQVNLPPYYADTPLARRDWANGLESMQIVDRQVGELLKRLDDEGLAENTIVVFIGDNGSCHLRGKQFLYDAGTSIPMFIRWPKKIKAGQINNDLVLSIDIPATLMDIAGVKTDVPLQGKNIFSNDVKNRKYVFTSRDKMDETHDCMRAVRTKKYKLIQNLMPERPYLQYNQYKESGYPMLADMMVLYLEGKLSPEQAAFFAPTKPEVELYDLQKDPWEMHNVAKDPAYKEVKQELTIALNDWRTKVIKDEGVSDEFRAKNIFPKKNPCSSVEEFVNQNKDKYDFIKYGWPAYYPDRSLEEWKEIREKWYEYTFRAPSDFITKHPEIIKAYKAGTAKRYKRSLKEHKEEIEKWLVK